jgi:hypothetical protein
MDEQMQAKPPTENKKTITISNNTWYWFAWFAICFGAFQLITDIIRPTYSGENAAIRYFLGIAPNFFPSIGIPALFVILLPHLNKAHTFFHEKKHLTANAISVTGLISWEFIQMTSKKLHFDWNDLLWTLIGALVFQLIWAATPGRLKGNQPSIKL